MSESALSRAASLAAAGRAKEAAVLFAENGRPEEASRLFEEACDFSAAASEALRAGDPKRAVKLAALAGDEVMCSRAVEALAASADREGAKRAAEDLAARGLSSPAGAVLEALGEFEGAAQAFVASGDARRAAACFERAGRPADGARALETALRRDAEDHEARLLLGRLLARHGRTEAAVRALQKLPPRSPERASALPLLARCFTELGLNDAATSAREEMVSLGIDEGSVESSPARPTGGAAVLFGRYEVVREVASTPHARVLEAKDRITGTRVAVKIFAAAPLEAGRDAILRFEREARALAELRHPNVVPLHAYLPEGPAMALAWMAGGSLLDRSRKEPITPRRAAEIAGALLAALGEAHRLGILHRDVKPTNVLFDEVGTAFLSDFGAAHLGDLSSTATAGAIGTFAYMSPEQRLGRPATLASDLFGVGAVFYELLTGRAPEPAKGGLLPAPPSSVNPDLTPAHDAVRRLRRAPLASVDRVAGSHPRPPARRNDARSRDRTGERAPRPAARHRRRARRGPAAPRHMGGARRARDAAHRGLARSGQGVRAGRARGAADHPPRRSNGGANMGRGARRPLAGGRSARALAGPASSPPRSHRGLAHGGRSARLH
ncbi:MAG: serine/threonine protein kinase [Polyangiaceae bacterium]|nr:serine/threonine protein kinase [Polyangiaceae bacterium]